MKLEAHQHLEAWITKYGGTALLGYLCFLLVCGKACHHMLTHRGLVCGILSLILLIKSSPFQIIFDLFIVQIIYVVERDFYYSVMFDKRVSRFDMLQCSVECRLPAYKRSNCWLIRYKYVNNKKK